MSRGLLKISLRQCDFSANSTVFPWSGDSCGIISSGTLFQGGGGVILSTLESLPGKQVQEVLGVVCGSTIRARWLGKDIMAALRTLVGGEIREYTEMLAAARKIALERMEEEAQRRGADAVLGIRLATSMVMSGAAELIAYGTAVKLRDVSDDSASQ